jgi:hypothetical protein
VAVDEDDDAFGGGIELALCDASGGDDGSDGGLDAACPVDCLYAADEDDTADVTDAVGTLMV